MVNDFLCQPQQIHEMEIALEQARNFDCGFCFAATVNVIDCPNHA
jgi:hypothetical protein